MSEPYKAPPSDGAVEEQLQRILGSARFADSHRLSAFLRFVVDAKLAGQQERIQEYTIGVEVFERGESFDPRIDSIVRVEARRLRDRLAEYYAANGNEAPVVIRLPRRGYVPEFVHNGHRGPSGPDLDVRWIWRNPKIAWGTALAAVVAGVFLLLQSHSELNGELVALSLESPPGGALLTPLRGGGPAVSPDGSCFVFAARDDTGVSSLYLRSLDRAQPQRLVGTENAVWPFWSPDGGKIGFGALEKLKILDLEREETRMIADTTDALGGGYWGGAWSEAEGGVIVIATQRGPLLRIPAAGGELREALVLAEGERAHREPAFLPDGKRFLYRSVRNEGPSEIRVADLDTESSELLFHASSDPKYAQTEDGRQLLFFRDGASLVAREIDPRTLELRSAPVTLATGLPLEGIRTFSAAGAALAYFHGPSPVGRSRLAWRSRTGQRLGTLSDPSGYVYISLSPDERTVAATTSSAQADVWTIDVMTGVATRQTEHAELDRTPIWSPDGRRLLISTTREGDGGRIYALSPDGSAKAAPWLDYPDDEQFSDWPSHWHPATSTVLFFRRAERGHDIWEKRPGTPPQPLISAPGMQSNARLSPDRRHVAYVSNELGEREIFLCTYPSTGSRIRVSPHGGNYPLWKGDGSELYYVAPDGNVMAVEISAEQPLKASLPRPLFRVQFPVSPASTVYQYAVTKDGERFLVVEEVEGPSATVVLNWERLLDR